MRKNLSEGLYIMLDENLGGGVSLQKNIAELPGGDAAAHPGRATAFERDVLLTPVLAALERGNDLQRAAVLEAFDGSFFKGRSYARQPEGMIDVGNDREFGFLYQPELEVLEADLRPALDGRPARASARRQASSSPSFFRLPERTRERVDPDGPAAEARRPRPGRPRAARAIVADEPGPSGAEDDPERIALLAVGPGREPPSREAVLQRSAATNGWRRGRRSWPRSAG